MLHGVDRLTADLDVVVSLEHPSLTATLEKLEGIGYRPRAPVAFADFADPEKRRLWRDEKQMRVFSLWGPGNCLPVLDLFVEFPLDMDRLLANAQTVRLQGVDATIASVEDLVSIKRATGRPRDLADVEALNARREN